MEGPEEAGLVRADSGDHHHTHPAVAAATVEAIMVAQETTITEAITHTVVVTTTVLPVGVLMEVTVVEAVATWIGTQEKDMPHDLPEALYQLRISSADIRGAEATA